MSTSKLNPNSSLKAADSSLELSEEDFLFFCETIEEKAGISLKASKQDLVKTRLRSCLSSKEFNSYSEYRHYLEKLPLNHQDWQYFINLLTTNKTDFFREKKHFDYILSTILPNWLKSKSKNFRAWSAASSSGEEAYTLAMLLDRHMPKDRTFQILGTDIDSEVINFAKNAVYPFERSYEIPQEYHSCLDFGHGSIENWFRIKNNVKSHVSFEQHNLITSGLPSQEKFDLVLCRNVLIYFAPYTIQKVSNKLFEATKSQGFLCIGHSESLQGIEHFWISTGPSIFKKN